MKSKHNRVLLAGGTGLLGSRLTVLLIEKGYQVHILSRRSLHSKDPNIVYHHWDLDEMQIDAEALDVDYIINLAGAGIADKRWTQARKKIIIESRTKSAALILKGLQENKQKVAHYIGASAVGIYGNSTETKLKENQPSTNTDDFMVDVCRQWEAAHSTLKENVGNLSITRIGIVLSTKGGALKEILKPLELARTGTYFGNGQMIYSWIHIDDMCNIFVDLIEDKIPADTYNAVAPNPATNKYLVEQIEEASNKRALTLPAPSFIMKLVFGEMSNTILNSTSASSEKIENAGFQYSYPILLGALRHLLNNRI
jgi:uncharacterized protein (TIGR01777 family)